METTNTKVNIATLNKSSLQAQAIQNGYIYFVEDTKELFFDFDSKRVEIKDILILDTDAERTSILFTPLNKFYFCLDTQVLWLYKDGQWFQVSVDLSNYYTKDYIDNNYDKSPTIINLDNSSEVTISQLEANAIYETYAPVTKLLISSVKENSVPETIIKFQTGSTISVAIPSTVDIIGNFEFKSNSYYVMVFWNNTVVIGERTKQEATDLPAGYTAVNALIPNRGNNSVEFSVLLDTYDYVNPKVEIKTSLVENSTSTAKGICGLYNANSVGSIALSTDSSTITYKYGVGDYNSNPDGEYDTYDSATSSFKTVTVVMDNTKTTINGVTQFEFDEPQDFTVSGRFCLYNINNKASMSNITGTFSYSLHKNPIYYCKIWSNDQLVYDLVPVQNDSSVYGFLNLVDNQFYTTTTSGILEEYVEPTDDTSSGSGSDSGYGDGGYS